MEHTGWHLEIVILIALLGFIGYSMLSKAISRTVLTLPIIFVVLGFVFAGPIHSIGLEGGTVHSAKRLIAEITLVLVLFADASHVRFARLRNSFKLPLRMLVIGLPLTIALGTVVALILNPGAGVAMALLTAAVLTPTDAALGQAVVSSPDVPDRIGGTINVESGLNDGLVLPFVLIGAIFASAGGGYGGNGRAGAYGRVADRAWPAGRHWCGLGGRKGARLCAGSRLGAGASARCRVPGHGFRHLHHR